MQSCAEHLPHLHAASGAAVWRNLQEIVVCSPHTFPRLGANAGTDAWDLSCAPDMEGRTGRVECWS